MKVRASVKKISPTDMLVRRKGVLRVIVPKGTKGKQPGQKRNKQRQG